jgi:hypothetical protein
MRTLGSVLLIVAGGALGAAACSATASPTPFGYGGNSSEGTGNSGTGNSGTGNGPANGSGGGFTFDAGNASGNTSTGAGGPCTVTNMNVDMDGDGWTPAQGDCNDCDPNVNPGAIDVAPAKLPDGGVGPQIDSNCNNKFDPPTPCDTGLVLADVNAGDAAKAIELCQTTVATPATPQERTWGVISSEYVHADGSAFSNPGLQVGIQSGWGPNVHTQGGSNMLVISSGHARTSSQTGACKNNSCSNSGQGTAPPGFPQDNPACIPDPDIFDDIGLELNIRAPTNATGYSFSFKFYSMEYPFYVCDSFNDQFIALVSPPPMGSINGNISFDAKKNPVSVNLGFFDVCDPSQISLYAADCNNFGGGTCPNAPSPYCPSGTGQLQGTGFDVWDKGFGGAGATSWLSSQAPVKGGSEMTIRFAMWDTGDDQFDSTTLIDNFQWIATGGSVVVQTMPMQGAQ